MASELLAARNAIYQAEDRLQDLIKLHYPVGTDLEWSIGGWPAEGTVFDHSTHGRLRVRNARTGKTRWIHYTDIVDPK